MLKINDRSWAISVPARDRIALGYRRLLADGTPSEMQGESWAFVITGPGLTPFVATGARLLDIEGAYFELAHATGVGPALVGKVGLRWALAEVLPGGFYDTRFEGQLTVTTAPALSLPAPTTGGGELAWIIENEGD